MLSMVVRQGISVGFWKAMPTPLIGPVTVAPATRTSPDDAGNRPVTSFMMVDLPQPDGPTTAMNSPLSMLNVASARASVVSLPIL
jgi:hypothetical protein